MDVQGFCISFFKYQIANCPASGQSGTEMNKNAEARTSSVPEKGDPQSGTRMLRYWNERPDAGMPMPAASASIPMPSYVD
jgi:hypothetical protein